MPWTGCLQACEPGPLQGRLWRLVESQERIATTELVDSLDEQALLESLLEHSKPPLPVSSRSRHYLLQTPFRYPPLRHGSRFGRRFEPSLFYGALGVRTMLAEAAYYRLLFIHGMSQAPTGAITSQHTAFRARYRTGRGLRLQHPPFDDHRALLTDPADYRQTQALGAALREAGIEAFEYRSARDGEGGCNVALFTPRALSGRAPERTERWICSTRTGDVQFLDEASGEVLSFDLEDYLLAGRLPAPAA